MDTSFRLAVLSVLIFLISIIWLVIRLFKRSSRKKPLLGISISILLFIFALIYPSLDKSKGFNQLKKYEWGSEAAELLIDIGVKEIRKITVHYIKDKEIISGVRIITEKTKLGLYPSRDHDGTWDILWISNYDFDSTVPYGKDYYVTNSLKYDKEGRLIKDIYDYETESLIEKADEIAASENKVRVKEMTDLMLKNSENADLKSSKTKITLGMEERLIIISEDIISSFLNYPANAKFHSMLWTFSRDGTIFNVGGKVTATNAFNVKEDIEFLITYEAYNDYDKIKPTALYINGVKVSK